MAALLPRVDDEETVGRTLSDELRELLEGGWHTCPNGVLVLAAADDPIISSVWNAEGLGLEEYEINDIRVPDEDFLGDPGSYLPKIVSRGLVFARAGLHLARPVPGAESLHAVLSTGVDEDFLTHGTTVKFFTKRGGFPTSYLDLERFKIEAIALLDMSDAQEWHP